MDYTDSAVADITSLLRSPSFRHGEMPTRPESPCLRDNSSAGHGEMPTRPKSPRMGETSSTDSGQRVMLRRPKSPCMGENAGQRLPIRRSRSPCVDVTIVCQDVNTACEDDMIELDIEDGPDKSMPGSITPDDILNYNNAPKLEARRFS